MGKGIEVLLGRRQYKPIFGPHLLQGVAAGVYPKASRTIQKELLVVGTGTASGSLARDIFFFLVVTIEGGPEPALCTDIDFHQIIKGLLEPSAVRNCVQNVEQQGGGRLDAGEARPAYPIRISRPYPYGIFWGGPHGPGVLKTKTGCGFPGDGF